MVAAGEVAPPASYWKIKPEQHGLVCKTEYLQYSKAWDDMGNCYHDFCRGWQECEKASAVRAAESLMQAVGQLNRAAQHKKEGK